MSWQVGLYVAAVLLPLAAFAVEAIFIRQFKSTNALDRHRRDRAFLSALGDRACRLQCREPTGFIIATESHAAGRLSRRAAAAEAEHHEPLVWSGSFDWVMLGGTAASTKDGTVASAPGRTWSFPWGSPSTTWA